MKSLVSCLLPALALASPLQSRDAVTAVVDLSVNRGPSSHLASGIIYGEPDTQNQIPDNFYTGAGLNWFRAGGAQLNAPNRGWIWNEYRGRFQSTLNNYQTARKYGANFFVLPHDIWGTDHANSSTKWPGDNGDWSNYDAFLNQLISDIKANNMIPGLSIDIWNEPDISVFWARSQQQWAELYGRTYKRFRSDPSLNAVNMTGPTLAGSPSSSNTWWTTFMSYVAANNVVPNQWIWHEEGGGDIAVDAPKLSSLISQYKLPALKANQININEYGTFAEQVSSATAWYIGRFERLGINGLRGNWLSGSQLHDYLASLLYRPGANGASGSYYPVGNWWTYNYYAKNQTGYRAGTTASTDGKFDVYATVSDKVRILCGTRLVTGTWQLTVENLSSVGLPTSGTLNIQTWGLIDSGHTTQVTGPTNRGVVAHTYSGNSVTFPIYQTTQDANTAWAFEFSV